MTTRLPPFDVTSTDTTGGVPPFIDWVRAMLDGSHAWRNAECRDCGVLLPGDDQPPEIPTRPFFADEISGEPHVLCELDPAVRRLPRVGR